MTFEEALTELRGLAWRVRYARMPLEEFADEVSRVIALAYPSATTPTREPHGESSRGRRPLRTSTGRPIPPGVSGPPPVKNQLRAAAPDAP